MPNPDEGIPLLVPYQRPRRNTPTHPDPTPKPLTPVRRVPDPRPLARRPTKATELYRLFDNVGILLYVGITMQDAGGRLQQHADKKPWWPLVTDIMIQRAPTKRHRDFEYDEMNAILNEFPMFNIRGVPWRERRPRSGDTRYDELRNRAEIRGAVARLDDDGVSGRLAVHKWVNPERFQIMARSVARRATELSEERETLVRLEDLYFQRAVGERQWQDFNTSGERARLEAEFAEERAARQASRHGDDESGWLDPGTGKFVVQAEGQGS